MRDIVWRGNPSLTRSGWDLLESNFVKLFQGNSVGITGEFCSEIGLSFITPPIGM
ncbi:hypothetical protein LF1_41380 [Rubripirellula obstinata]|uniref:Uncharacterized protein n=1 Tax=Rubripirellula obstinata TaxID=406547 RepID=A0A5B1CKJ9_9BACT|nr:hypothetical protein LF1_41380 [Rubripirellula obstinata]